MFGKKSYIDKWVSVKMDAVVNDRKLKTLKQMYSRRNIDPDHDKVLTVYNKDGLTDYKKTVELSEYYNTLLNEYWSKMTNDERKYAMSKVPKQYRESRNQ
jgi:hypothetical protein